MRIVALMPILLLLALPAMAQKPAGHVLDNPASDAREGGETIADALEVPFPFSDTGATCDNIDDYDEVCPYSNSTSPDVVYTFVPDWDCQVDIDLAGSTYDTKAYVYDENLNLVACNDDYYPNYVSLLQSVPFFGGERYYLVIDGYGGDCGEYVVGVCDPMPCDFGCYGANILENEPPLYYGYEDNYNGGCDVDPPVFQILEQPAGEDRIEFCGLLGYAGSSSNWQRDVDWLQFMATGQEVRLEFWAPYSFDATVDVLFLDGCDDVSLLPYELSSCGMLSDLVVPTVPGQMVTVRVEPLHEQRPACTWYDNDEYKLFITGAAGTVATETWSWSAVKAMYE